MAFLPENTVFQETIVSSYDLSNGTTDFASSDISKFNKFSLQFTGTGLNGTNTLKIQQSNDNTNWSDITEELELPLSDSNFYLDKSSFIAKYVRVSLLISGTGVLNCDLIAKR